MNDNKRSLGFFFIVCLSAAALLLAAAQLVSDFDLLAVYNVARAALFAFGCVYFYRNPTKVNFTGPLGIRDEGNASPLNIKVSYFLSYLFSVINLAISVALYFDR